MCCVVMWCGLVSCGVASCHVVWCAVVCCAALRSAIVCDWLWCVVLCGGVVCCGHMTCPVVCYVFMWCGWCGWLNGVLVAWQLGLFIGCLAAWGMLCGVCTLWCVVPYAFVCSVMSCLWVNMYLLPFQGRGGGW